MVLLQTPQETGSDYRKRALTQCCLMWQMLQRRYHQTYKRRGKRQPQQWAVRGKMAQGTKFEREHWKGVRLCVFFSKSLGLVELVVLWKEAHRAPALEKESHQCGSHLVLLQSVACKREGGMEFIQWVRGEGGGPRPRVGLCSGWRKVSEGKILPRNRWVMVVCQTTERQQQCI